MGAVLKLRITGGITDAGAATNPFIGWKYTDGLNTYTDIIFNWVAARDEPFEADKWVSDYNAELKRVIELDLVPSGEWSVTSDDYYLYIESNVPGRTFHPYLIYNTVVFTAEITNLENANITFLQSIDSSDLLYAYNDNVLRFTGEDLFKLELTVNDALTADLYSQPNGEFFMNLRDFATILINQNKFADEILPDIESNGYMYADPSLFLKMDLSFTFQNFAQAATFYFLKAVSQIKDFRARKVAGNFLISPGRVTYYEGYPFDVTLFAASAQQVVVHNRTTFQSVAMDVSRYVNRLFLSQGSQNFTIDDILPLQTGTNRLEIEFGPTDKKEIIVQKKESKCAPYFKFYRNGGGFGYIRFESEVSVLNKSRESDEVRMDFSGIQNTLTRSLQQKETSVEMEFQTEQLENWEMENFQDFISSPRVEMYVEDLFQKQNANSWIGVKVKSNSLNVRRPKMEKGREKVKIEIDLYNLTL